MKGWGVLDGLALGCLVLLVPYHSNCDVGSDGGKSQVVKDQAQNVSASPAAVNASLAASSTAPSPKHELHLSSREGVVTGVQSQPLPTLGTTLKVADLPPGVQVPKVPSGANDTKELSGDKGEPLDASKHWAEGGPPAVSSHVPAPKGVLKSTTQKPAGGISSSSAPHAVAPRKGAVLPAGEPSEIHPPSKEHPGPPPMIPIKSHPVPVHVEPAGQPPIVQIPSTSGRPTHPHPTGSTAPKTTPKKLKPQFTMVRGDRFTSSSESIIESATTGRDYVFPLVLLIFAVPGLVFLIRFLYKRGTEFTERQQYHRMYLIDGMYNAR